VTLRKLLQRGLDVGQQLAVALEQMRADSLDLVAQAIVTCGREFSRRLVDTIRRGSDTHLLTDGKNIFLEDSAKRVVDVLKNCRQPVFSICLSDTVRQVHADIRGWRKKAQQSASAAARSGRQRRLA